MKNIKEFASRSNISEKLIRAVVRQSGGWEGFKDHAEDIANYGAAGGFLGFTYYTETCAFYARNRAAILECARNMADDLGEDLTAMVRGFNCLGDGYTSDEIGETLYGSCAKHNTYVANALSFYALEEVARAYCDALADEKGG